MFERNSPFILSEKSVYFFCLMRVVNEFENVKQRTEKKEGSRVKVVVYLQM